MDEDRERRRRRLPFDLFDDEEFERIFEEVQRMFGSTSFRSLIEDLLREGSDKRFIRGFSINIGPDGKPKIQEFGTCSKKLPTGESVISEEREPLTDIIEGDEEVAITLEIPGVEKEDIDVVVKENTVEIKVEGPLKYHKVVDLPCEVKPTSTKATYKNGILDIVLEKKEKEKEREGFRVNID
jgi:HSP20 family protein